MWIIQTILMAILTTLSVLDMNEKNRTDKFIIIFLALDIVVLSILYR